MEAEVRNLLREFDRRFNAGDTLGAAALGRFPMPMRVEGAWMYLSDASQFAGLLDLQRSYMAARGAPAQVSALTEAEARSNGRIEARVTATARTPEGQGRWRDESSYFLRRDAGRLVIEMIEVHALPDGVLSELTAPAAGRIHRIEDILRARRIARDDTQETP